MKVPSRRHQGETLEFGLGDPLSPLHLITLLTWPEDLDRRQVTLRVFAHQQFGAFMQENPLPHRDRAQAELLEHELIEKTGGWGFTELPSWADEMKSVQEQEERWRAAGALMCFLRRLDAHHPKIPASLNRTAFMFERLMEEKGRAKRTQGGWIEPPMKSWAAWRRIAPLCAAAHLACIDAEREGKDLYVSLTEPAVMSLLFGRAKWFRNWAMTFRVHRAKAPLLSHNDCPEYGSASPPVEPLFSPLEDSLLGFAQEYKSADRR